MTVNNNNATGRSNDPEQIDLIDLVMQLWRGKMTIFVCVIVAILLAVGYILVAKEKWTSTAIITQPDVGQIATYNNAMSVLYGDNAPKVADIQTGFIGRFSSAFSALSAALDNQEEPEELTITPSVKGQSLPLAVSYVGESAEGAQRQLAEYIQQVDESVAKELEADLKDNIKLQTTTLEDSLKTQEVVAQEQKDLRIKQIQEALRYAEQADALKSMIEHESTRPLVFSGAYYQTKQNLLDIGNLKIETASIHAYRYVMKPTLPVRRDSPKKAIVLVLAVLLGGMIGAGVVLGRNALRNYKPKAQ